MRLSFSKMLVWILSRPVAIILVIAAVTLFFAWPLPNLSFKTSIYDLQVEDLPETAQYNSFRKTFGSDEIIRVVIKCDNVFDSITFRKVEQLADTAAAIEGVRRVISLPGVKKAVDVSGKWSMEKFSTLISPVDLFQKNLISTDRKTTALTLILNNDADPDNVIQRVRQMLADGPPDLMLYQIGMPLVSEALASYTQKDFFRLPPLTFLLIATYSSFSVPQGTIHPSSARIGWSGAGLDLRFHDLSPYTAVDADDDCPCFSGCSGNSLLFTYCF